MNPILQTYINREGEPTAKTIRMREEKARKDKHLSKLKQNT